MILCRECGRELMTGSLFCSECGSYQLERAASQLETGDGRSTMAGDFPAAPALGAESPGADPAKPPSLPSQVTVIISTSNREATLSLQEAIRVGRHDPDSAVDVELDLTPDAGAEHGVSRLHAAIARRPEGVFLVDLDSTNGTLVNNHLLQPKSPHRLNDGDEIRFGRLLVRIFFD